MGKAKGTQGRSLSCESGSGLLGAGKATTGQAVPGRWAENPPGQLAPPPARPSPPGLSRQIFFSFLFQFLPTSPGILCQEDSALSLLRPRPPRLDPLPAPLTSARLLFAPALLSPVPSFTAPRIIASGNNPRQRRGPRPALGGAGAPDLWLQLWAELSPAQTRRPRALAWPQGGVPGAGGGTGGRPSSPA